MGQSLGSRALWMLALRCRQACGLSRPLHAVLSTRHMADAPKRDVTPHYAADRNLEGTYTERQAQMKRPTSPHVIPTAIGGDGFIYELPPVAWSSIVNRATGVVLTVGMAGVGGMALVGADVPATMASIGSSSLGPLFKFGVCFPLTYHYVAGIRHAVWDAKPESLTNDGVEKSTYAVVGSATAISALAMFI